MTRSAILHPCALLALSVTACLAGCKTFHPPPLSEVPFLDRAHSGEDEKVRVTVAVLSADESRVAFGANMALRDIQPVWLEVVNKSDETFYFLTPGMDDDAFSPREASWLCHGFLAGSANKRMDRYFEAVSFHNPVPPGETVSGFVYTHVDEGSKVVDVDLVGSQELHSFTFTVPVPGLKRDVDARDLDALYAEEEWLELDTEEALRAAIEALPAVTTGPHGHKLGDPLNIVLIGHDEHLFPALMRRGWHTAEQTYLRSVWKTSWSFLWGSRYLYSPVSPLFVLGRSQDIAAQKARHSIHQRNHFRLWLLPWRFRGLPVYVGQISRDIGVRPTRTPPYVTHKIDPDVDEARDYLMQDLLYSQAVQRIGFTGGVGPAAFDEPRRNKTGDPYFTDGLRLVMVVGGRPTSLNEIEFFEWENAVDRRDTLFGKDPMEVAEEARHAVFEHTGW